MMAQLEPQFWLGKRVLVTGHTGFKGSWLTLWLSKLGAQVFGIGLAPNTDPNLFNSARINELAKNYFVDIRDAEKLAQTVDEIQPEIVFHLAAQSLVRVGYAEPLQTFLTNMQGTANLLESLRSINSIKAIVAITTDKIYQNQESHHAYAEDDPLGGHDPYSASKAAAEIIVASYRDSYFSPRNIGLATARAGNVIGGGDWAQDRLIPDAIRAWSTKSCLDIRRPEAIRPWQHVLEPLHAYLILAQSLYADPSISGAFNFGPNTNEAASVLNVIELARNKFFEGGVNWGDGHSGPHEAGLLLLNIAKAKEVLGIIPRWHLGETVTKTMSWYQQFLADLDPRKLCEADIAAFCSYAGS
jgi:CDP-glucose 4,6-dehydratase